MNKKAKFLFFCMIFVAAFTYGQDYSIQSVAKTQHKTLISKYLLLTQARPALIDKQLVYFPITAYPIIDPGFYTKNFGFFCKKELQLEKLIKVPFKFRLGSVAQCDWLEGKPNTGIQ